VEQAVAEEAPAHMLGHFIWLDKRAMQTFEAIYQNWTAEDIDDIARDLYGRNLAAFLFKYIFTQPPPLQIASPDGQAPTP
jgi:hypothetical protein